MWMLGPIGFTTPWLLLGLIVLPVLWIILRAIPPAPIRRRFPGVALLLGLTDERAETDRTPWWLLVLRTLAIAAVIVAFAGPVLHPDRRVASTGPLLILADGTWADARDWPRRVERMSALLTEAGRAGRPVALVTLTDLPAAAPEFQTADAWATRLPGVQPRPWAPDPAAVAAWAKGLTGGFETYWLSDGLARPERAPLLAALETHGRVTVFETPHPVFALRPAVFKDGAVALTVLRAAPGPATSVTVIARGPDPAGVERDLSQGAADFTEGATEAAVTLNLPAELRNRVTGFVISGARSAGAVSLTDDTLKRRKVALIAGVRDREGLELLSPLHYLREALRPEADVIEGSFADLMMANPDVVILADVARLAPEESDALAAWVKKGGTLLRFAGPRLAQSDVSREEEDPLMPVRLRAGGREVGGAMSWGQPKDLRPFPESSPFYGLTIPKDVTVNEQVMAQPDPSLADRTIASLSDGTPLVTRKALGQGQVILFHVTANAEWSTLPLSGLFVEMLDRLAVATRPVQPTAADLKGTTWVPKTLLDAYGAPRTADQTAGIAGETLAAGVPGPKTPPGLYAAQDRRVALNVIGTKTALAPALWPARIVVEGIAASHERPLKGTLLSAALLAFLLDLFASLWLSGRLRGARAGMAVVVLASMLAGHARADAAEDFALRATHGVVLAHVLTGDAQVDRVTGAGLTGLSAILAARTSVEPDPPMAVNIETDDLSLFPFLYWPVTENEPLPSEKAYAKLNDYLRTGGMILFDTRDGDVSGFGAATPTGQRLQAIAAGLDIPPLEPIPNDHVLTRSFYLLQDFPGRYDGQSVWVEAAPPDAVKAEGMPFRDLNDGVSPVVIGGNDWASAWAVDDTGAPMFPVGRGQTGERQREISYRFGINLIMYVLTGNYKSDQVHVPALLQRLGQ
ncbi:MAG: DUF4159 domain-containing protein [Rhodobacteraceae bacterium]|nr:DUF4159 domain-containing protein [Paracoccaceae bacterium]